MPYKGLFILLSTIAVMFAQSLPTEYQNVLNTLQRQGDFKDNVFKINIPRNDLKVTIDGIATPTPFGFGGWLAMTKGTQGEEIMMGDLVLLADEVNPVMSVLLDNRLGVTALHNHFFFDNPRLYFMHVHGQGKATELAKAVQPALNLIGNVKVEHPGVETGVYGNIAAGNIDTSKLNQIVKHSGEQNGAVYKITVGRDDIKLVDRGARINSRMGLNTWASFFGSDSMAEVAGDVAMLGPEVNPVLKALRRHGLKVVAIHQHMIDTQPTIYFLHYWGTGPVDQLAKGFRAALDELGKRKKL